MLSPILEFVGNPNESRVEPRRVADLLGLPLENLATLAQTHRNTLSRTPGSPQVQAGLGDIVKILVAASQLMEGGSPGRAVLWFKNQPLSGFGGKTAMDLVREGKANAVMEHLQMLADGVYA
ncbi:antitoxin Xre/MbcA/ParS toxin-binding domain-containing protein [Acidisphaera sp. S103]|uniref:antitoxin Xre/MbcA/ParS toxin-binding domain-containing protein n=1 Tax=Acidisphaera sp. S103 TaxID=1747223 RepID=UPI00131AE6EF|nr:antitoxin Xre/MbcA/ParS toxin-binding domain-containing protein [Acidisphaera sp. S103]